MTGGHRKAHWDIRPTRAACSPLHAAPGPRAPYQHRLWRTIELGLPPPTECLDRLDRVLCIYGPDAGGDSRRRPLGGKQRETAIWTQSRRALPTPSAAAAAAAEIPLTAGWNHFGCQAVERGRAAEKDFSARRNLRRRKMLRSLCVFACLQYRQHRTSVPRRSLFVLFF